MTYKKTAKFHIAGPLRGESLVTGGFPSQRTSKAESVSMSWRHHAGPDDALIANDASASTVLFGISWRKRCLVASYMIIGLNVTFPSRRYALLNVIIWSITLCWALDILGERTKYKSCWYHGFFLCQIIITHYINYSKWSSRYISCVITNPCHVGST